MRIFVHIRDKTYTVSVGAGQQSVEWLANVALLRFDRTGFDHISCRGFKYLDNMLNLTGTIESQMQPDSHCYLLLEGDQGFDDNLGDEPADEDAKNMQTGNINQQPSNIQQDDINNNFPPPKQPTPHQSATASSKALPPAPADAAPEPEAAPPAEEAPVEAPQGE
ncbi:hypothetical protein TRFO_05404 [Tritrichomonas foetus]|uniref:Uncharacterized protein n=1 Tax=Tritrichomonas foetus TaxID=1144522 RepID=A0A1J4K5K8_9EUKA|nr:hypothetical protein TRFO_05404 [Tritrichomonas foetus]|eukprot:OHT06737.1 hypothetical protein TRFO_05404 [Tritrichomonas foetus]